MRVAHRHSDEISQLNLKIERLRVALKPLADIKLWHDTYPDATICSEVLDAVRITADDVLRAREALTSSL